MHTLDLYYIINIHMYYTHVRNMHNYNAYTGKVDDVTRVACYALMSCYLITT